MNSVALRTLLCHLLLLASFDVARAGDVYLSLTTSPARLKTLSTAFAQLQDLINGSKITGVIVNIPTLYRNDPEGMFDFDTLADLRTLSREEYSGKIVFNGFGRDLGPISKIVPTVEWLRRRGRLSNKHYKQPETIVISLDDDQLYSPEGIEKFIAIKNNPYHPDHDAVLTLGGGVLEHWFRDKTLVFPNGIISNRVRKKLPYRPAGFQVDLVEGYMSVAYYAKDVDTQLMTALATQTGLDCRLSDDLVISFALGLYGKTKIRIWRNDPTPRSSFLDYFEVMHSLQEEPSAVDIRALRSMPVPNESFELVPREFTDVGALYLGSGYSEDQLKEAYVETSTAGGFSTDRKIDNLKYRRCLKTLNDQLLDPTGKTFLPIEAIKAVLTRSGPNTSHFSFQ